MSLREKGILPKLKKLDSIDSSKCSYLYGMSIWISIKNRRIPREKGSRWMRSKCGRAQRSDKKEELKKNRKRVCLVELGFSSSYKYCNTRADYDENYDYYDYSPYRFVSQS